MGSVAPILELFPAAGEWTEVDYYRVADCARLVELSDGDVEVLPLPTYFHQLILLRLSFALHAFVSAHKLGRVAFAPLPIKLWPGKIREPDLMFMAEAHLARIGVYWGIPDLAVEILSPGTEHKDREIKRAEYAKAGIGEYWIIEPEAKTVSVLRLVGATYAESATLTERDALTSPLFPGWEYALGQMFAPE
jgi:Uma2 family endonuclease